MNVIYKDFPWLVVTEDFGVLVQQHSTDSIFFLFVTEIIKYILSGYKAHSVKNRTFSKHF